MRPPPNGKRAPAPVRMSDGPLNISFSAACAMWPPCCGNASGCARLLGMRTPPAPAGARRFCKARSVLDSTHLSILQPPAIRHRCIYYACMTAGSPDPAHRTLV